MFKIEEFTICLHCGCSREVVNAQMEALKPLENKYKVHWNNRIDRYPFTYSSFSLMINHTIATSPTEWVFLINDRTVPLPEHIEEQINQLENGFAWTTFWGAAFMGFSKELVRKIGWWDERFTLGGWEDRDWLWRLREANVAIYEGLRCEYGHTWKSPLNGPPGDAESYPHWERKWNTSYYDKVIKNIPEEQYPHWDLFIWGDRPDISQSWKTWDNSILAYGEKPPHAGEFSSVMLGNRQIILGY